MAQAFDPDKFLAQTAPVAQRISPAVTEGAQGFDPDKFLAETGAPSAPKSMLQAAKENPEAYKPQLYQEMSPENKSLLTQGISKVMNYPLGLVRTGVASTAGLLSGNPVVDRQDVVNAVKGNAPSSKEYAERLGVPEGPKVPEGIPLVGGLSARDVGSFGADVAMDPLTWVARAGKLNPVGEATEAGGKKLYKAGLKNLDMANARAGAAPVSDLLLKNRVTGDSATIFQKMDDLGQNLLDQRNAILKKATRSGAEVDMGRAVKEAQDYVDNMKKIDNPELRKASDMLQKRINDYTSTAAKEPQQVVRQLPYTEPRASVEFAGQNPEVPAYDAASVSTGRLEQNQVINRLDAKGKPIVNTKPLKKMPGEPIVEQATPGEAKFPEWTTDAQGKWAQATPSDRVLSLPQQGNYEIKTEMLPKTASVLDITERIPGPTPIQTTGWKTSAANRVGDQGYDILANSSEGRAFDKALASGHRVATEESVGRALGPEAAQELSQKNAELGSILSSDDKAYIELEKEARRMGFSSVDGMLLTHPHILATKKFADITKGTAFRTTAGLGLVDFGKSGAAQGLINRGLLSGGRRPSRGGLIYDTQGLPQASGR